MVEDERCISVKFKQTGRAPGEALEQLLARDAFQRLFVDLDPRRGNEEQSQLTASHDLCEPLCDQVVERGKGGAVRHDARRMRLRVLRRVDARALVALVNDENFL